MHNLLVKGARWLVRLPRTLCYLDLKKDEPQNFT